MSVASQVDHSVQSPHQPASVVHVVDDDEAVRDSMRWLLEANGFQVRCFESAEAFLAAGPPRDPIACVLLDVRMPGLSGLALHDELIRRGSTVPVVFITGHGEVPMAVETMKREQSISSRNPLATSDYALWCGSASIDRRKSIDKPVTPANSKNASSASPFANARC